MTHNVNLYDASLRTRRDWLSTGHALAAVALCALVVGAASTWLRYELAQLRGPALQTSNALQSAQAELTELTQRVAEAKPDARLQAELQLAQSSLIQRHEALALLRAGGLGNEVGHAAALNAFARQSVSGLWLTGLVLDNSLVALRGRALSPELIPAYVARLNKEQALQGRAFRALEVTRPPEAGTASAPARSAPYVEFSLLSAQGTEAPAKETTR